MTTEKKDRETWGSGSYTTPVYVVEARATFGEIILYVNPHGNQTGHLVLTPHEWKRVHTSYGPVGIPNGLSELYVEASSHHFLSYQCAMGMACWLQADQRHGGIETRLVQIEFSCSYSTKTLGTSEPMNLQEDARQLLWRLQREAKEKATPMGAVPNRSEIPT